MKYLVSLLIAVVFCMFIRQCFIVNRLANTERQLIKIEQQCDAVLAENEKLVRMNNQTLYLLVQGGWDYDVFDSSTGD